LRGRLPRRRQPLVTHQNTRRLSARVLASDAPSMVGHHTDSFGAISVGQLASAFRERESCSRSVTTASLPPTKGPARLPRRWNPGTALPFAGCARLRLRLALTAPARDESATLPHWQNATSARLAALLLGGGVERRAAGPSPTRIGRRERASHSARVRSRRITRSKGLAAPTAHGKGRSKIRNG
jgi:hypothetical protein